MLEPTATTAATGTATASGTAGAVATPMPLAQSIDLTQITMVIVYLILIIIGAYFLTRYVAKRRLQQGMRPAARRPRRGPGASSARSSDFGHMVAVVDRIAIDREKTLMVVEFEGVYYLLGTTAERLECIDKVAVPESDREREAEELRSTGAEQSSGAAAPTGDQYSDETFGERFKRAFSVVLRSYLPAGMRDRKSGRSSFEDELRARAHSQSEPKSDDGNSKD